MPLFRALSFTKQPEAPTLRQMVATQLYVITYFFSSTDTVLTLVPSTSTTDMSHNGSSITGSAASTPPAASAALGDGFTRTVGFNYGSDNHTLARIEEIRGDACPAPAWLTLLAGCCCKHPRHRASLQLRLLCCFKWRSAAPRSTSAPPDRAATRCSPGGSSWSPRQQPSACLHQLQFVVLAL